MYQRPGRHHRKSSPIPPAWSSADGEQAGRLSLSRTGDQTIIVGSVLLPAFHLTDADGALVR